MLNAVCRAPLPLLGCQGQYGGCRHIGALEGASLGQRIDQPVRSVKHSLLALAGLICPSLHAVRGAPLKSVTADGSGTTAAAVVHKWVGREVAAASINVSMAMFQDNIR